MMEMEGGVAYLFAIIFFVLALNLYFVFMRMRKGNKRKRMDRVAVDEAKQALWREKEVARRIEREQDDAMERVNLKNETLALYEEVRRRHAKEDELERMGLGAYGLDDKPVRPDFSTLAEDDKPVRPDFSMLAEDDKPARPDFSSLFEDD